MDSFSPSAFQFTLVDISLQSQIIAREFIFSGGRLLFLSRRDELFKLEKCRISLHRSAFRHSQSSGSVGLRAFSNSNPCAKQEISVPPKQSLPPSDQPQRLEKMASKTIGIDFDDKISGRIFGSNETFPAFPTFLNHVSFFIVSSEQQ
jgi:hypothetical protein